jgi:hypothetical protein
MSKQLNENVLTLRIQYCVGIWRLAAVYQGSQSTTDKLTKIVSYIVLGDLKDSKMT